MIKSHRQFPGGGKILQTAFRQLPYHLWLPDTNNPRWLSHSGCVPPMADLWRFLPLTEPPPVFPSLQQFPEVLPEVPADLIPVCLRGIFIPGIALFSLYGCIQSKAHYCHIGMFHGQLYFLRGTHSHFSAPLRSVLIMCHSLYL